MRFRNILITLNNPTPDYVRRLRAFPPSDCQYGVWQVEKGANGTPHIQGYFELRTQKSLKQCQELFPRAHVEARKGTQEQAISYCRKVETRVEGPYEFGNARFQGTRTDIIEFRNSILKGSDDYDLICDHPREYAKFTRFATHVRNAMLSRREKKKPRVVYISGPTGCGKTRKVWETYRQDQVYSVPMFSKTVWFDGYIGQPVVVFDEFYGQIKLSMMLKLLDRYPVQVPVKGGFVYFVPDVIILTSNVDVEDLYPKCLTECVQAFRRRIDEIHRVGHDEVGALVLPPTSE